MAISDDGDRIAVGDENGEVSVWSTQTGECVQGPVRFPRGKWVDGIHALDFHPNGRSLAIGGGDCDARIWHFDEPASIAAFSHRPIDMFDQTAIADVEFSPDGSLLVSQSFEWREVRIWDVASGRLVGRYDHYQGGNRIRMTSRFTEDGRFVTLELGGFVLDTKHGEMHHQLGPVHPFGLRYNSNGHLAWNAAESVLRVYEISSGARILERAMAR
jgi:WD40 repeat protein